MVAAGPAIAVRHRGLGTYVGLFLVTMSTLMLEVGLTRIFSVTMWYHFAFVAISLALFGLSFGSLLVHYLPGLFVGDLLFRRLGSISLLFGVAVPACFVVQLFIPFTPRLTVAGILSVVATCLVISVPFTLSGIVVSLVLTRFPGRVNRLYAADLVGAGIGCVIVVVAFSWLDGPSVIVLIGAIGCLGALAFAAQAGDRRGVTRSGLAALVLAGLAVTNGVMYERGDPMLEVIWAKGVRDPEHLYERWNAFSRLTVDGDPDDPAVRRLSLVIDSTAGTSMVRYSGDPTDSDFVRSHLQNLVHTIRTDADVAVIGAGGGGDVLSALEFEQRTVTGIEINGDIVDIVNRRFGDFTGHLDRDPRVDIVNEEARGYLTRTDRRFDIIQISLIDTWAATSSGAFALSENGLYTTEAWDIFLDRLQPGGLLTVTRFFNTADADGATVEPLETYRTVALAAQVLTDRGVADPRRHMVSYRTSSGHRGVNLATLMVSPQPISDSDRLTLAARAQQLGFAPVLDDDRLSDATIEALTRPGGPGAGVSAVDADISPPTDNRPFFFQMANLASLRDGSIWRDDHIMRPVLILGMLAIVVFALAACCVAIPLTVDRRRGGTRSSVGIWPFTLYFTGIGLGFLLVEVSQLQRLSTFLGHPTYGLTVVLASVLVFSGVGSMLTERFVRVDRRITLIAPLAALVILLAVHGLVARHLLDAAASSTTPARIATAVGTLAPPALLMGMPLAIGMRVVRASPDTPAAFLLAVNGATSVCASVAGISLALFFGISTAFWAGAAAYVVAAGSLMAITGRRAVGAPAQPIIFVETAFPEPRGRP